MYNPFELICQILGPEEFFRQQKEYYSMSTGNGENEVEGPQGWRPEAGDEVVGTIADIKLATSTQRDRDGNYPQYPLLLVKKTDGDEVFVHCFHMTLQQALLERRPEIGHRIKIKFHGKQTLKSDKSRSVAIYSMELPDTPKTAKSIYDKLERQPTRRSAPRQDEGDLPWSDPDPDEADAFLGS